MLTTVCDSTPPLGTGNGGNRERCQEDIKGLHVLYDKLGMILVSAESVVVDWRYVKDVFEHVDACGRHDQVLTTEAMDTYLQARRNFSVLCSISYNLRGSEDTLSQACAKLKGHLRGQDKVKFEDRLHRHLAESRRLVALLSELRKSEIAPTKPFQIRQKLLSAALIEIDRLLESLADLCNSLKPLQVDPVLRQQLARQVSALNRMRALAAKWRDNPSQKLADKAAKCLAEAGQIKQALKELRAETKARCKAYGEKFYNRAGQEV